MLKKSEKCEEFGKIQNSSDDAIILTSVLLSSILNNIFIGILFSTKINYVLNYFLNKLYCDAQRYSIPLEMC